ncbi:MAG: hypothetical protein NXI20_28160 [bacterium]|nr:hypothetical protein [bacterium]
MSILNSILLKVSSVKRIFLLFVTSQLVFLLMMTYTFPEINHQIGTKAFDLQTFGYSVSTAESIVNNLDDRTMDLYLFPQLMLLDIVYPFLLALLLSGLLFRLIKTTQSEGKIISNLLILPFVAMISDYSENIGVILMISKSIEVSETIVYLSSTATILKGVSTSVAWIAILVLSVKWIFMKIREKNNDQVATAEMT